MHLSREQRWILWNQYSILQKLEPDRADYYSMARMALENGYEWDYDEIAAQIREHTITVDQCKEVQDILDMFVALEQSHDTMSEKPKVELTEIRFEGFDANRETDAWAYARFLMEKQHKWQSLKGRGDNLNSHSQVIDEYRRMVRAWNQVPTSRKYELTSSDILAIVGARHTPFDRTDA